MQKTVSIFVVLAILAVCTAGAQVQIRGTVQDAESGDRLPSATVHVEGTSQGTVANAQGRFLITLSRIPAVLIIRHIGFRTERISIEQVENNELFVELKPVVVILDELVVSGEDPAVAIMRRVLAEKQVWRSSYSSTYAEVYTRFWLFREFDPIQVRESVRSAYWRRGEGSRELVRARRIRPFDSGTFRFAGPEYAPNFYDDEVTLMGTRYATPTHEDALQIYRFRLGGQRMIDDTPVWDIYFTPKRSTRPSFSGHIAVIDSVFGILEFEARPVPATVVTPPVEIRDVQYEQRYVRLDNGIIVPLDLVARGYVAFGRLGASYPPARYEQISSISNYAIEIPTPDSMFAGQRTQRIHPLVDRSDYLFVRNPTIIPLTPRETESLSRLDPRMTVDHAFRPDGMLRMYTAIDVSEDSDEDENQFGLVGYLIRNAWVWYNRVDGFHPGIGITQEFRSGLTTTAKAGYSVEQKKPSIALDLIAPWNASRFNGTVFLSGSVLTTPTTGASVYGLFAPGFMTYMGFDDYFDYYRRKKVQVGGSISSDDGSLSVQMSANMEDHHSLKKEDNFNGWLFRTVQRENPVIPEGRLTSFQARLKTDLENLNAAISVEHAPSSLFGSDFDFTSVSASLTWRTVTFFRRRDRPNRLRITLVGSTFRGTLPLQRYGLLDGSTGFYALPGSFRTLGDRPMTGSRITGIFWEHDFTTALMERLGLWGLAERGSGVVLFGAHGRIWETTLSDSPGDWIHEAGIGLMYPFRLPLRIDIAARLDTRSFSLTLGRATL